MPGDNSQCLHLNCPRLPMHCKCHFSTVASGQHEGLRPIIAGLQLCTCSDPADGRTPTPRTGEAPVCLCDREPRGVAVQQEPPPQSTMATCGSRGASCLHREGQRHSVTPDPLPLQLPITPRLPPPHPLPPCNAIHHSKLIPVSWPLPPNQPKNLLFLYGSFI